MAANLRWLIGYRHPRYAEPPGVQAAISPAFAVPRPLADGAASVGERLQVLPAVYHALWAGQLVARLDEPLGEHTMLSAHQSNSGQAGAVMADTRRRGEE